MQLQAREFKRGLSVNKWSDVEWTDGIYVKWFCFEVKWSGVLEWSEVSYDEVLEDKYIRVTVLYVVVLLLLFLLC
jgi:hypothetical protein